MKPEVFLATHSLFSREEFAEVLRGRGCANATLDSHLAHWRAQGRIARVKRGLFIRVESPGRSSAASPDFIALASRMAADAAVAYHTALEAHGYGQSVLERLTFATWTKVKPVTFQGRQFVPVRPRKGLLAKDRGEPWIERVERSGIQVRITTLERTVVDVLDRPWLAGGTEEVWRSLRSVPAIDPRAFEEYLRSIGSATLAAKAGFFLATRREELAVPAGVIERVRRLVPAAPVYFDRTRRGTLVAEWSLIVPRSLLSEDSGLRV